MSSALVRYGAGSAVGYMSRRRYIAGSKIARRVYRHIKRNRRGYKRAGRAMYRASKMARRMVPSKKNLSKVHQDPVPLNATRVAIEMGILKVKVIEMPQHTVTNETNHRLGSMIHLKGVKICRTFERLSGSFIHPIEMHWALIQMKEANTNISDIYSEITDKFFRNNTLTGARSSSFINMGPNSVWDGGYNCFPMNPNANFRILTRRKKRLIPFQVSNEFDRHLWQIDKYYKIGKNMSFDIQSDILNANPIVEVFWYMATTPTAFPDDPVSTAAVQVSTDSMNTVYFAENMG